MLILHMARNKHSQRPYALTSLLLPNVLLPSICFLILWVGHQSTPVFIFVIWDSLNSWFSGTVSCVLPLSMCLEACVKLAILSKTARLPLQGKTVERAHYCCWAVIEAHGEWRVPSESPCKMSLQCKICTSPLTHLFQPLQLRLQKISYILENAK